MYAKPFTKVLRLLGCQVTSKMIGIVTSEINWNYYKHVQCVHRSRLQSDSSEKHAIFYGAANMHKNFIMGKRCVYNWTNMMVHTSLDIIVRNDRKPCHVRIFYAWIKDWESDILRTWDQENKKRFLHKYKNIRFFDDEYNQTYIFATEHLEFKGPTRRSKQYCVFGKPLDWRDGDNLDLLLSREINDDFMVLTKGVEQDPDMGAKIVHPSIDDDSEVTDSDKEENINWNYPRTSYDG